MTLASPTTEETDPFCIPPLEAAALLFDAPWRRFAVIGDSLSAGTSDPTPGYATLGWPDRVADVLRRVRPDLAYLNIAVVGATTAEILRHQADRMREFAPDLLHLPSGANDIVRRTPNFGEIEQTLRDMYRMAADTGAQLTTFALSKNYVVPVFPDFHDRVRRLNDINRALAAEFDAALIDMWDHPVNDRSNLLGADGIHFSTASQAVLASEVVKQLAHLLDTPVPRAAADGPRRIGY
ncbi:SGNH/GDSL hydrolase family protein [Nocardia sp. NPDC052316]|uniref:SGNH/GDSL hydrolase family protein n=1 Tax=Nocardia sp. NPDC052316 TaxID=3364329 RepID=UPI0037C989E2